MFNLHAKKQSKHSLCEAVLHAAISNLKAKFNSIDGKTGFVPFEGGMEVGFNFHADGKLKIIISVEDIEGMDLPLGFGRD